MTVAAHHPYIQTPSHTRGCALGQKWPQWWLWIVIPASASMATPKETETEHVHQANRGLNSDKNLTCEISITFCSQWTWHILIHYGRWHERTSTQPHLTHKLRLRNNTDVCCFSLNCLEMLQLGQQHWQSLLGNLAATRERYLIQQSHKITVI